MHHTVLLKTITEIIDVKKGRKYIDATAGEGNIIKEILGKGGSVLAIDWDYNQIKKLRSIFGKNKNLILVNDNFSHIKKIAERFNFAPVDGIIFDLGLSMNQLEEAKKGFSYKNLEEELDMRIDLKLPITASCIINQFSKKDLLNIFSQYGEEIKSKVIVDEIIKARQKETIKKVGQLIRIIDRVIKRKDESVYRRIFQALRIKVNNELENLKQGLEGAIKIIKPQGKIAVISFHSIESRLVKLFIKEHQLKLINKKVIKGERSSQLRVFSLE